MYSRVSLEKYKTNLSQGSGNLADAVAGHVARQPVNLFSTALSSPLQR
jgi:hypothetical protein